MSIAFTNSLRSLQGDRNRGSLVALVLAGLLFLGWLVWFFWAPVTLYETGQIVQTSSDGVVVAHFPSLAQIRLQLGQVGQLQFTGSKAALLTATVADIAPDPANDQLQVTLYADMDDPNAAVLQNGLTGQAAVVVEKTSPARLFLRATGYGVDTPPVVLEPTR